MKQKYIWELEINLHYTKEAREDQELVDDIIADITACLEYHEEECVSNQTMLGYAALVRGHMITKWKCDNLKDRRYHEINKIMFKSSIELHYKARHNENYMKQLHTDQHTSCFRKPEATSRAEKCNLY